MPRLTHSCREPRAPGVARGARAMTLTDVRSPGRPSPAARFLSLTAEPQARRLAWAAIIAGLAVRLLIAALAPLLPDEAYYWEWSRRLAAGYFDHPPAVAWLIAAGTALAGHTPLGVRIGTLATGTAAVAAMVAIARRLGGETAALRAALFLLCTPLAAIGLAIATTDAPALLAVAGALLCITIALESAPGSGTATRWWLLAGAAFGCGLLAKLTVGIVGAATALALVALPSLRRQLRTPGPWAAVLIAFVVATPVIAWNASHGWVSVRFQLAHGLGAPHHGSVAARELSLLGSQAGLISPGIFLLCLAAAWLALRRQRAGEQRAEDRAPDARALLAVVGATVLAFFAYSAVRRPVEANWPAPAFVALLPLAAASSARGMRRWYAPAALVGAALVVVALAQLAAPVLPLRAARDPVARAHGWSTLARAASSVRDSAARATGHRGWLAADRYQDAAGIAFLAPGRPTVFALGIGSRPSQYDLWPSFARTARPGDDLVVALDTTAAARDEAAALRPHFDGTEPAARVALTRAGDTVAVRDLWRFTGWRGSWPTRSPGGR